MRDTVSFLSRFYLMAAVWFAVLVGTSLTLMGLMDPVYTAAELSPIARTVISLAIGFTAATTTAWLGWSWLSRRSMGLSRSSRGMARSSTVQRRASSS
jgi:hypothetical protein